MVETIVVRSDQRWGEALKELRQKGRASQRKFGSLFGMDESTIARLESNSRKPVRKIPFYERLAGISWINEPDVAKLLLTQDAPRWLEPDKDRTSEAAAEFGQLLRFYRERIGLSQRRFVGTYPEGFDESTVARIEAGSSNPPQINQFYDRLPAILQLSQGEYAGLLLTGRPPRWLVPYLYEIIDESRLTKPMTFVL